MITKLPFAVPNSPVEEATAEWVEQRGGNPFLQLTVPEASRKLIQACGRLIRKEADRGRVTILDRRLLTKRYGKGLLDALPVYTADRINKSVAIDKQADSSANIDHQKEPLPQ